MGTSGTGSFSDYSSYRSNSEGNTNGGSSGENRCDRAFSTEIEEVEKSPYFKKYGLPPSDIDIFISLGQRLEVIINNESPIGYLPTKFNYLASCIRDGFNYKGKIIFVTDYPIVSIRIDVAPY